VVNVAIYTAHAAASWLCAWLLLDAGHRCMDFSHERECVKGVFYIQPAAWHNGHRHNAARVTYDVAVYASAFPVASYLHKVLFP